MSGSIFLGQAAWTIFEALYDRHTFNGIGGRGCGTRLMALNLMINVVLLQATDHDT